MNTATTTPTRLERIRAALTTALAPQFLEVIDDSHAHAGHAGALTGRGHFCVVIVADCFAGIAPLKRHRMVYSAVDSLMATDIHALSIDARAPAER